MVADLLEVQGLAGLQGLAEVAEHLVVQEHQDQAELPVHQAVQVQVDHQDLVGIGKVNGMFQLAILLI